MADWREALDGIAAQLRELEGAQREIEALRHEVATWRDRARAAEQACDVWRARDRAKNVHYDPLAFDDLNIMFGNREDDAVKGPNGPSAGQFLYGLIDLAARPGEEIFFRVERPKALIEAAK